MKLRINDNVLLKTFLNTKEPLELDDPKENYWKLIGKKGRIISIIKDKALVLFEIDILSQGLHCHNEMENTLLISISDLEKI